MMYDVFSYLVVVAAAVANGFGLLNIANRDLKSSTANTPFPPLLSVLLLTGGGGLLPVEERADK